MLADNGITTEALAAENNIPEEILRYAVAARSDDRPRVAVAPEEAPRSG